MASIGACLFACAMSATTKKRRKKKYLGRCARIVIGIISTNVMKMAFIMMTLLVRTEMIQGNGHFQEGCQGNDARGNEG